MEDLNHIITMFLDHAEDMARQRTLMYMKDWEAALNEFLAFRRRNILRGKGKVSSADMERLALAEYIKFSARRLKTPQEPDGEDSGGMDDLRRDAKK